MMASEDLFQCNVSKSIDLLIFDAIKQVRLRNKRPASSAIFKAKAQATNFTEKDIKNRIEGLINEDKLVDNKTTAEQLKFFFCDIIRQRNIHRI